MPGASTHVALLRGINVGGKHALPMKTLVLPARGIAPDDRLEVRSRNDRYKIELKEALEEQAEFVWSPFVILEHRRNDAAS